VSQPVTVAWLATRELWMTFRLLLVLLVAIGPGAVVGVLPTRVPDAMARLAAGLGAAIVVSAAVAAWSVAEERLSGRAGWLITRSVGRATYIAGWYGALATIGVVGLAGGAVLGWLAIPQGAVELDAYRAALLAMAATLLAATAAGVLAGTLLRPAAALIVIVTACALAAAAVIVVPASHWIPGGAALLVARASEPTPLIGDALRAAGVALAVTAAALVASRIAIDRTDL
jgi:hypothetical protein